MRVTISKYWLTALAGLSMNISSGWFGLAIVTPSVATITHDLELVILLIDVFFGILFLQLNIEFQKNLDL